MITEGVHDMDEATYHGDPCPAPSLSASIAKLLVGKSPRHAWLAHPRLNPQHRPQYDQKFDLGSAFHALMLGKGADIIAIDAADYRTNAAKDARDAARAAGKIPMLVEQHERTKRMVAAVQAQLPEHSLAAQALAHGLPEQTLAWQEDNGVWCRARLDWMPESGSVYPDFKTTEGSAGADGWDGIMFGIGCEVQDAFYRRGLRKLGLSPDPFLLFVVAELDEPHLIATHRCGPVASAIGDRKVEYAIRLWEACLSTGQWPAYGTATASHDPSPWVEQRWVDRETALDDLLQRVA